MHYTMNVKMCGVWHDNEHFLDSNLSKNGVDCDQFSINFGQINAQRDLLMSGKNWTCLIIFNLFVIIKVSKGPLPPTSPT